MSIETSFQAVKTNVNKRESRRTDNLVKERKMKYVREEKYIREEKTPKGERDGEGEGSKRNKEKEI